MYVHVHVCVYVCVYSDEDPIGMDADAMVFVYIDLYDSSIRIYVRRCVHV